MSEAHREAWLRHPATRELRKTLASDRALAFEGLLNKCRRSSDPEVRKFIAELDVLDKALGNFASVEPE